MGRRIWTWWWELAYPYILDVPCTSCSLVRVPWRCFKWQHSKDQPLSNATSLFLIIDNNTRSRLVAQALVSDETTESYKWILECTKKVTATEPLAFITDADPAADAAVAQVYESFVRDFFLCRNSLCEEDFYEWWSQLTETYVNVKDYLMRALYSSRRAWACAFTLKTFTAGTQTTFCVKGLNSIIKCTLLANGGLCDFANALDAKLEVEAEWNYFFEYCTLSSCMRITSVGHDLFPEVDKQITQYLTPHILSTEHLEMAQCLYFIANQISFDINTYDKVREIFVIYFLAYFFKSFI